MSAEFAGMEPPGGVNYGEFSFRVKPHVLRGLAAYAATAVPSSAAIASLTCFRARLSQGSLTLAATDMERTVIVVTSAVLAEGVAANAYAEAFIPAKKLQAILKEAPDDADVTVTVKKDKATVAAGAGSWVLRLPDAGDYPALLDPKTLHWPDAPREKFLAALKAVRHVVCKDAGRPPLTQVDVRTSQVAGSPGCVTASDGTRFARAPLAGFPQDMTIPSSVLDGLMKLLAAGKGETIGVAATEESLAFMVGPVVLAVARRSTPFPDMDGQILNPAQDNDQLLCVDRDELAAAVRRVRVNADADTAAVALVASGDTLSVEALDKGGNSASEAVPAAWGQDKDRVLCVNHVFLAEALAAHPDKTCAFRLGRDRGERRSVLLLDGPGLTQVLGQMSAKLLGY